MAHGCPRPDKWRLFIRFAPEPSVALRAPFGKRQAEHWVNNQNRSFTMKADKTYALLLAMYLGCAAPLALAATDLNDQRAPGTQPHGNGHMNGQDGATGSGTPADGMGTGNGGTHDNGTDNTGGDGTDTDSGTGGNGGDGSGAGPASGSGGSTGSGSGAGSGS